jgi:hypothetical protein
LAINYDLTPQLCHEKTAFPHFFFCSSLLPAYSM